MAVRGISGRSAPLRPPSSGARRPLHRLAPTTGEPAWPRRPQSWPELQGLAVGDAPAVPLPSTLVELPGLPAPVFLPTCPTPQRRDPFLHYVAALRRADAFESHGDLEALAELSRARGRVGVPHADRPRVAIIVSEPRHLLPGQAGVLELLAARVRAGGGEPVLIPPLADVLLPADPQQHQAALAHYLRAFDGVIGPGGADVHPHLYRERPTHAVRPNFVRDRFEAAFFRAAIASDCFVLGICRSHQLIHAALGGKLAQDVVAEGLSAMTQNQLELAFPREAPFVLRDVDGRVVTENRVHLAQGSDVRALLGDADSVLTNSLHHQAVLEPGAGLRVTGVVRDPQLGAEMIEVTEGRNVLTVQFHPELMTLDPAMADLADVAVRRAHVFRALKALPAAARPGATALAHLHEQLAAAGRPLLPADERWLRRELHPCTAGPSGGGPP